MLTAQAGVYTGPRCHHRHSLDVSARPCAAVYICAIPFVIVVVAANANASVWPPGVAHARLVLPEFLRDTVY